MSIRALSRPSTKARFKSLASANRELGRLREALHDIGERWRECDRDRIDFAKLAADGPAFHNPLQVAEVKARRDELLRTRCGLNPDGSPLEASHA